MWSVNTRVAVVAVAVVVAAGRIITPIMWSVNTRVMVVVVAGRIKDIDLEVDSFIMRSDDDNRLAQDQ